MLVRNAFHRGIELQTITAVEIKLEIKFGQYPNESMDEPESESPVLTAIRLELGLRREMAKASGRGSPPVHACTGNPEYRRGTALNRLTKAIDELTAPAGKKPRTRG